MDKEKVNYLEGNIAKVSFLNDIVAGGNKSYDYINSNVEVEVGDTVLVSTKFGDTVARIVDIVKLEREMNYEARIIAVLTDFNDEYVEAKEALYSKHLEKLMAERKLEIDAMVKNKEYAEIDDKFKNLYERRYGKIN